MFTLLIFLFGTLALLCEYSRSKRVEFTHGEYLCKETGKVKYSADLHMEQVEESLKKGGA